MTSLVEHPARRYERYLTATRDERLPFALVDLDCLDRNVDRLLGCAANKPVRIASKSVRCVELLRYIARRGGAAIRGVMAYSPAEAHLLASEGFADVLIAYPTAQPADAALVAAANRRGRVALAVDDVRHVEIADAAARTAEVRIPLVVDVDVAFRPLGSRAHVGVRRSPLRSPADVAALAERIGAFEHVSFEGVMAYEAHIAGLDDRSANAIMKRFAKPALSAQRRAIVDELTRRGVAPAMVNGGGTGSVSFSAQDPALTEVTIGSGFLDSHLFDHYEGLSLDPAACFALQVTRRPAPGLVTCQGGGLIASGAPGLDRLPLPYLPDGLRLTTLEGAGEVQTPLVVPAGMQLDLGAPVFFRHAKAGELAEHFDTYLLVRGDRVEARVPTYRGAGHRF